MDESVSDSRCPAVEPTPVFCPNIFLCLKRAALSSTPEQLEQLLAELGHAQVSLSLIYAAKDWRGGTL
jgi:hypothetical protein